MFLRNTSHYPTDEIRELVRFATADVDMRRVCVNVKNSRHARRGMAYRGVPGMSNAPKTARYLITIGIGSPEHFPREDGYWNSHARTNGKHRRGGQWPEVTIADWREQLITTAAHEAKHIEQFRERLPCSEVACEHFAAHMLNRYRSERLPKEPLAQAI
jgi:hypothetical protein